MCSLNLKSKYIWDFQNSTEYQGKTWIAPDVDNERYVQWLSQKGLTVFLGCGKALIEMES